MQTWEYYIKSVYPFPGVDVTAELDKLGREGWELIYETECTNKSGMNGWQFTFKRPRGGSGGFIVGLST
jgi:hypothetical protein